MNKIVLMYKLENLYVSPVFYDIMKEIIENCGDGAYYDSKITKSGHK